MEHRRYQVLDAIRGCALVSMILYHAAWDLVNMFGVDWPWYRGFAAHVWRTAGPSFFSPATAGPWGGGSSAGD